MAYRYLLMTGMLAASVAMAGQLPVTTSPVVQRPYRLEVTALAEARSADHLMIEAPFSGVMAPLPVFPGTAVRRGTIIARVLPLRLAAEVEAATADLRSARRAYRQTEVLARDGLVTAAQLDAAGARMEHARAALQGLEARLARGVVRAPFAGTIRYQVPAGAWVGPGMAIAKLSGTGGLYLTARLTPDTAVQLKPGMPVRIAARGDHWPGRIYGVAQRAGHGGLVAVYVRCACTLLAGEFARLTVRAGSQPGMAVPARAVVMNAGKATVFRVVHGQAQPVSVTILHATRRWAWITGALSVGDAVIVAGAGTVRGGTPVAERPGARAAQ